MEGTAVDEARNVVECRAVLTKPAVLWSGGQFCTKPAMLWSGG